MGEFIDWILSSCTNLKSLSINLTEEKDNPGEEFEINNLKILMKSGAKLKLETLKIKVLKSHNYNDTFFELLILKSLSTLKHFSYKYIS
jgi:hypothetical protein